MLSSLFQKLSPAAEKKLLVLVIASFLLAGSCMVHFDELLKNEFAPLGIISLELASTLDNATHILDSWKTTDGAMLSAEWSLWFDYIFIITYVFLLCFVIHRVRSGIWKVPEILAYRLGTVLINTVIFAGFLDMVENAALLQLFYGDSQTHWVSLAYATAIIKFINLALGVGYVLVSIVIAGIKKIT
ncbi:MAG: hypothetical protein AAF617_03020 [Bacteroidota bacterium]